MYVCVRIYTHIVCSIPIYFKAVRESSLEGNLSKRNNLVVKMGRGCVFEGASCNLILLEEKLAGNKRVKDKMAET